MKPLSAPARKGIDLFNAGQFFPAHEALEEAWREESGDLRSLYQGLLQAAVFYLHLERQNTAGASKIYARCMRHLNLLPEIYQGVQVQALRLMLQSAWQNAGSARPTAPAPHISVQEEPPAARRFVCDRCGSAMREQHCKVICPNCGNRFDCSDLNIYFDF